MQKTRKPIAAGVLIIVTGCYMIFLLAPILFIFGGMYPKITVSWVFSFAMVIIGIMAVVSGIFALMRKFWRLVVAGSICAILACFIDGALNIKALESWASSTFGLIIALIPAFLAITTLVLLILGKKEFVHPAKSDIPTSN
jgi:threonine/homoserine efflux transporter RhtA